MKKASVTACVLGLLLLTGCAGPSWRETNIATGSAGAVPRDASGNPILRDLGTASR